jgi:hypothetical protein
VPKMRFGQQPQLGRCSTQRCATFASKMSRIQLSTPREARHELILACSPCVAREAGGSLNTAIRLFRATGDEAWNLTTILTRQ